MGDILLGLALMLVANVAVGVVLAVTGLLGDADGVTLSPGLIVASVLAGAVGFAGWPVVATWWKGTRSLRRDFGLACTWGDVGWGVLGFLGIGAWQIAAGIAWLVIAGTDEVPTNTEFLPARPGPVGVVLIVLAVAVVTPVVEELFFRGLALRAVARRWGVKAGVGVSAVLFGLGHALGASAGGAAYIVVVTTGFGVILGALTAWRGRLGPAIVAHVLLNTLAISVALAA